MDSKPTVSPYALISRICDTCGHLEAIKADNCKPGSSEYYKVVRKFQDLENAAQKKSAVKAEPVKEAVKAEPVKEAAKAEPVKTEPVKEVKESVTEPVKEPVKESKPTSFFAQKPKVQKTSEFDL